MAKHAIIWTTELVNETLEKMRFGEIPNVDCFHERDPELRAANLLFKLTPEETEEFIKCYNDVVHFVQTYCRFLTDYGRKTVSLRKYQIRILKLMTKEKYDKKHEDFVPENRNIILMQSRQSGKCTVGTNITIRNKFTKKEQIIPIEKLYAKYNKNIFNLLKRPLYYTLRYLSK